MGDESAKFEGFFETATRSTIKPFPFQSNFAFAAEIPSLINVPTGLGKTAMAVLGWLWRRNGASNQIKSSTPRRLVYCLPMRVLVEQTRDCAASWVHELRAAKLLPRDVPIHVLMGGEDESAWDIHPEADAIIIGTQDMLLSRALNRGYAASRARWPLQFGLLNTDCLWVFDEIQLMGCGLATTAQLEAFRHSLGAQNGHGCRSAWMSATLSAKWLCTVDYNARVEALPLLKLEADDHAHPVIRTRWTATKPLQRASAAMDDAGELAAEILKAHKPGTRTIVVVNTVKRACELFSKLTPVAKKTKTTHAAPSPTIVLLHSRFRPDDRARAMTAALASPGDAGTIIVSTQIIEAGVDVSATTLFTELAPWSSLVQRFGRCNRTGDSNANAAVHWIDLPSAKPDAVAKVAKPYEVKELEAARTHLKSISDVGLGSLDARKVELPFKHAQVIRRKDLIDLFDTTADLTGNDIDIDRFVREIDETDVRVFWRSWEGDTPSEDEAEPTRAELCAAPIGEFIEFCKKGNGKGKIFRRDFLEGKWIALDESRIAPGQTYMVRVDAGGYKPLRGWDSKSPTQVGALGVMKQSRTTNDGYDADGLSMTSRWQTIAEHTNDVCRELESILTLTPLSEREQKCLRHAARWHDLGKAHSTFQDAINAGARPQSVAGSRCVAKAPGKQKNPQGEVVERGFWSRYQRPHFRHELASALAVLQPSIPIEGALRDLVAYLIAAHHGKVRVSIRSFPHEKRPTAPSSNSTTRFARGVWDGDELPSTDLGGGTMAPAVTLSLEPMELGLGEQAPFVGEPSWIERVLTLREEFGPFRLAYLEAILRAADQRASAAASGKGATDA